MVTKEQAQAALAQAFAEMNEPAAMTAIAGILGVDSITFAVDDPDPDDDLLFWTATTRKGTTIHQAGTDGYTADPCHRSMRTGTRLTRAEADAITGRVWCPRCVDTDDECQWAGHADAVDEHGWCAVCQQ